MRVPLYVCVCVCVCVCVSVCVSVHVYALRIVSRDKILRFKNTFIIIIIYKKKVIKRIRKSTIIFLKILLNKDRLVHQKEHC